MYMVPTVNAPLPPLNALRAFEAAARLLSFTRAAHELHVTQTAVGHQMRVLEAYLGVRLFLRFPRRLALTPEGQAYARELGRVSDRIGEATGALLACAPGRSASRPTCRRHRCTSDRAGCSGDRRTPFGPPDLRTLAPIRYGRRASAMRSAPTIEISSDDLEGPFVETDRR
jgi:hypothetical protein